MGTLLYPFNFSADLKLLHAFFQKVNATWIYVKVFRAAWLKASKNAVPKTGSGTQWAADNPYWKNLMAIKYLCIIEAIYLQLKRVLKILTLLSYGRITQKEEK